MVYQDFDASILTREPCAVRGVTWIERSNERIFRAVFHIRHRRELAS